MLHSTSALDLVQNANYMNQITWFSRYFSSVSIHLVGVTVLLYFTKFRLLWNGPSSNMHYSFWILQKQFIDDILTLDILLCFRGGSYFPHIINQTTFAKLAFCRLLYILTCSATRQPIPRCSVDTLFKYLLFLLIPVLTTVFIFYLSDCLQVYTLLRNTNQATWLRWIICVVAG